MKALFPEHEVDNTQLLHRVFFEILLNMQVSMWLARRHASSVWSQSCQNGVQCHMTYAQQLTCVMEADRIGTLE